MSGIPINTVSKREETDEQATGVELPVAVWNSEGTHPRQDLIARETPVALVYNGVSHAVMMASPSQLEEFALGFSLTEGIIDTAEEVYAIDITRRDNGMEVAMTIASQRFMQLKNRRRNLAGRSGCGICGAQSLEQVRLPLQTITAQFSISHAAINRATASLVDYQPLQDSTGATHGAAWCDSSGNIVSVCEDVGRHNALDKLIGLLWSSGSQQGALLQQPGFLLMSSRASYEILQKAGKAGIAVVVAVSAPTSLAVEIAEQTGITLVGFSRHNRHVAYTHDQRLSGEE